MGFHFVSQRGRLISISRRSGSWAWTPAGLGIVAGLPSWAAALHHVLALVAEEDLSRAGLGGRQVGQQGISAIGGGLGETGVRSQCSRYTSTPNSVTAAAPTLMTSPR